MRVIYVDETAAVNFAVNYILLLAAAKLTGANIRRGRLILAAALGGIYAVLAEIFPESLLRGGAVMLTAAAVMVLAAFGRGRGYIKNLLVFLAAASAFAGAAMMGASLSGRRGGAFIYAPELPVLALSFALCYGLMSLVLRGRARLSARETARVVIKTGAGAVTLTALLDTGCTLTDPVGGAKVVVAEFDALLPVLPDMNTARGARDAVDFLERLGPAAGACGFVLLPYSAVGVKSGLLPAFRPAELTINGKTEKNALVAVTESSLGGGYQAIMGV